MIHHGDAVDVMAAMEPESVDAIVCDPPYGLEFMGKEWDKLRVDRRQPGDPTWHPSKGDQAHNRMKVRYGYGPGISAAMQEWHEAWAREALRVAKPSAYLLAFGGTRTVHRLAAAIEDAGWIIRDLLVWAYASGFPKSRASLKPSWEPIVLARKPGPLRNLNIEGCRIGFASEADREESTEKNAHARFGSGTRGNAVLGVDNKTRAAHDDYNPPGRWPPNLLLTDPIFDGACRTCGRQWDGVVGGGIASYNPSGVFGSSSGGRVYGNGTGIPEGADVFGYGDVGTYSRFFLIPKADRADREPVLGGLPEVGNVKWQPFRGRCTSCGHWQDPGETACPCGGIFEHETNRMVKSCASSRRRAAPSSTPSLAAAPRCSPPRWKASSGSALRKRPSTSPSRKPASTARSAAWDSAHDRLPLHPRHPMSGEPCGTLLGERLVYVGPGLYGPVFRKEPHTCSKPARYLGLDGRWRCIQHDRMVRGEPGKWTSPK